MEALGKLGDARALAPIRELRKKSKYRNAQVNFALALFRLGDTDALDDLIKLLADPDSRTRAYACEVLEEINNPRVTEALRRQLQQPQLVSDRPMLLKALLKQNDPTAFAALMEEINSGQTFRSIDNFEQLAELGIRSIEPLLAVLKDKRPDMREAAVRALGRMDDARVTSALLAGLQDPWPGVREEAAASLGRIADPSTADALLAACSDPAARVRRQVFAALEKVREHRQASGEPR